SGPNGFSVSRRTTSRPSQKTISGSKGSFRSSSFRHLDYAPGTRVTDLGPAAIDALLERGDLEAWAPLLRAIADDPWGATADTVLRLCDAHPRYGTSTLWRAWIDHRRRPSGSVSTTLAEARARAGLTQTQVAERLGVGQSDVSKLERRGDVRLSTLRAYARAIGARLHVGIQGPDEDEPRALVLPRADAPPSERQTAAS
ncbi:MAG: helix-turn-helix domain-containing protein, partial [Gemmatimonadota bacterium]